MDAEIYPTASLGDGESACRAPSASGRARLALRLQTVAAELEEIFGVATRSPAKDYPAGGVQAFVGRPHVIEQRSPVRSGAIVGAVVAGAALGAALVGWVATRPGTDLPRITHDLALGGPWSLPGLQLPAPQPVRVAAPQPALPPIALAQAPSPPVPLQIAPTRRVVGPRAFDPRTSVPAPHRRRQPPRCGFRADCGYADLARADHRLRQAYAVAGRAGVARSELASVQRRWATLRAQARAKPAAVVAGYDGLARSLERRVRSRIAQVRY